MCSAVRIFRFKTSHSKCCGKRYAVGGFRANNSKKVAERLRTANALADGKNPSVVFLTTDDTEKFKAVGEPFLGFSLRESHVELVDL